MMRQQLRLGICGLLLQVPLDFFGLYLGDRGGGGGRGMGKMIIYLFSSLENLFRFSCKFCQQ